MQSNQRCIQPLPIELPGCTTYHAGYLVAGNAGWRKARPVVEGAKCTGCGQCYLYCPDGTVSPPGADGVHIDYDFCKGCGICAKICRAGAVSMKPEHGEGGGDE